MIDFKKHNLLKELEIKNLISHLDTTYGGFNIYELPDRFVIEIYTGGWSDNESLLIPMTKNKPIYGGGALQVFELFKFNLEDVYEFIEFVKYYCDEDNKYLKQDKYTLEIVIE